LPQQGLVERPWSTAGGGFPRHFICTGDLRMRRQLSIFIDESGDFGAYQSHSPYYIIALLLHDQKNDIRIAIQHLDEQIVNLGFDLHTLHTGPLIRREAEYQFSKVDERRRLLNCLVNFSRHVEVMYTTLHVEKKECPDIITLIAKLSKQIKIFVDKHMDLFCSYDEIIVYYDNGQIELTRIITSTMTALIPNVTFRKIKPPDYQLFQLADMYCSLELTAIKFESNTASNSEQDFFHNARDFKKNHLKKIRTKRLD
jgi:hypothetical protein